MLYLLTFGPLVLTIVAWVALLTKSRWRVASTDALLALCVVTISAVLSSCTVAYYAIRPLPFLPPWQDPEIMNLGLLFLFAPISMLLVFLALFRGAAKWLVAIVEIASFPLFVIGLIAVGNV